MGRGTKANDRQRKGSGKIKSSSLLRKESTMTNPVLIFKLGSRRKMRGCKRRRLRGGFRVSFELWGQER
jgi:hypothetical protein